MIIIYPPARNVHHHQVMSPATNYFDKLMQSYSTLHKMPNRDYDKERQMEEKRRKELRDKSLAARSSSLKGLQRAYPITSRDESMGRFFGNFGNFGNRQFFTRNPQLRTVVDQSKTRFHQMKLELFHLNENYPDSTSPSWKRMDVKDLDEKWGQLLGGINWTDER